MLAIGGVSSALVMAPVLSLLAQAYGIGVPTAEHPNPLLAPQANLMASVAQGIFGGELPWGMIGVGVLIDEGGNDVYRCREIRMFDQRIADIAAHENRSSGSGQHRPQKFGGGGLAIGPRDGSYRLSNVTGSQFYFANDRHPASRSNL